MDATQEQTDVESFDVLEPLRTDSETTSGKGLQRPAEYLLVDKATCSP